MQGILKSLDGYPCTVAQAARLFTFENGKSHSQLGFPLVSWEAGWLGGWVQRQVETAYRDFRFFHSHCWPNFLSFPFFVLTTTSMTSRRQYRSFVS